MNFARVVPLALVASLLFVSGCKSNQTVPKTESPDRGATPSVAAPAAAPVDPATAGNIAGTVHLKGTPPAPVPIDMSMDPACSLAGENLTEQYVVNKGGLANVFLYVKAGLPASSLTRRPMPVRVDQHGCRFVPHVAAVQGGGLVEFTNSDTTMHNVHTITVGGNPSIDVSQGPGAQPQVRQFTQPEDMIRIGCNNHPWMNGFLNVAPNAYFAVSKADGTFVISGLPPGTYTLAAVHEKLGEQDVQVTVPAHGTAKQNIDFTMH